MRNTEIIMSGLSPVDEGEEPSINGHQDLPPMLPHPDCDEEPPGDIVAPLPSRPEIPGNMFEQLKSKAAEHEKKMATLRRGSANPENRVPFEKVRRQFVDKGLRARSRTPTRQTNDDKIIELLTASLEKKDQEMLKLRKSLVSLQEQNLQLKHLNEQLQKQPNSAATSQSEEASKATPNPTFKRPQRSSIVGLKASFVKGSDDSAASAWEAMIEAKNNQGDSAAVKKQNADLQIQIRKGKSEIKAVKAELVSLQQLVTPLQEENASLREQKTQLESNLANEMEAQLQLQSALQQSHTEQSSISRKVMELTVTMEKVSAMLDAALNDTQRESSAKDELQQRLQQVTFASLPPHPSLAPP